MKTVRFRKKTHPGGVLEYLERPSKRLLVLLGLASFLLVTSIDWATGLGLSVSLLYGIPILLLTWSLDRQAGISMAVISATAAFLIDFRLRYEASHPAVLYWNFLLELGLFSTMALVLAELKRALKHEKALALTDALTGAANRRAFYRQANIELERARRYGHPFTLLHMDLDNFKEVNDSFGHQVGDTLLCTVVETIQGHARAIDLLARLGGDEFALLLPETRSQSVRVVLEKIRGDLLDIMRENGWPVTFSIGAITFASPPGSVTEMVQMTDALMYSVKNNGKNSVRWEVRNGASIDVLSAGL
jgi:diguanylate cyclase (GGDEF)-like protein